MDEWLVLQSFYNGLTMTSRAHIDAAAGGAFLDMTIMKAKALVEKMVSNQGWSEERLQSGLKALADPICNLIDYTTRVAILGAVARDGLNTPVPSDYAKEGQHTFLAPLPGIKPSWWRH